MATDKVNFETLCAAVSDMDMLSQGAFENICTMCALTLAAMEKPEFWTSQSPIADVLTMIRGTASAAMNGINCCAEQMGCNFIDEAERRRREARSKAIEGTREMRNV